MNISIILCFTEKAEQKLQRFATTNGNNLQQDQQQQQKEENIARVTNKCKNNRDLQETNNLLLANNRRVNS